jgi:hypothetical protein
MNFLDTIQQLFAGVFDWISQLINSILGGIGG